MKMTRILTPLALAVSAVVASHQALAGPSGYAPPPPSGPDPVYSAGTAVFRVGASFVDPDNDRDHFRIDDRFYIDQFQDQYDDYDRLGFRIDDDTSWNFTAGFMPMDHFMLEVGYIGETDHDLDIRSPDLVDIINDEIVVIDDRDLRLGQLSRWSGFAMANWFPVCTESWVQPYVGIGAHYTDFDNHNVRGRFADFLVDYAGGVTPLDGRVRYDDDWGWAAQAGVDIMFGRDSNWLVNAAVMYLDTDVKADLHYRVDNENFFYDTVRAIRTDFDLDPWVYNLGIGYRF